MNLAQCPACGNKSVTIDLIQCKASCRACDFTGKSIEFVNAASENPQTADRKDVRIEQLENQLRLKDEVCTSFKNTVNTTSAELNRLSRELLERDELIHKYKEEVKHKNLRINYFREGREALSMRVSELECKNESLEQKLGEVGRICTKTKAESDHWKFRYNDLLCKTPMFAPSIEAFRKIPKPSEWVKFPMDKLEPDDKLGWRELHKRQEEKHEFQMLRQKDQSFHHLVIVNLLWVIVLVMVFAWSYNR